MDNVEITNTTATLIDYCQLSKESLKKLKKLLPTDAETVLAHEFDISKAYVRRILLGYYLDVEKPRLDVIEAAVVLAQKHKSKLNEKVAALSEQISQL